MKYLIIILLALSVVSCSATKRKQPTPFVVSDKVIKLKGCVDLQKEVKEWNKNHPDQKPKKADC